MQNRVSSTDKILLIVELLFEGIEIPQPIPIRFSSGDRNSLLDFGSFFGGIGIPHLILGGG